MTSEAEFTPITHITVAANRLLAEIEHYEPSAGEDDDEEVAVKLGDLKALRCALAMLAVSLADPAPSDQPVLWGLFNPYTARFRTKTFLGQQEATDAARKGTNGYCTLIATPLFVAPADGRAFRGPTVTETPTPGPNKGKPL